MIEVSQLTKVYGDKRGVDKISFTINEGEIVGFLGPNGAGKTTTIKMILGFLSIDSGSIHIKDFDVVRQHEQALACIGGIVENPDMYNELSGLVNLKMHARVQGGISDARIQEVIQMVGMQNRIGEKMKKYSLGMKQRIGIAQAMLHNPSVLVLDEPTNGLDPAGIRDLRDLLRRFARENNVAVFVSSHMLAEMELMCDRVAIINDGRLQDVMLIGDLLSRAAGRSVVRVECGNGPAAADLLRQQEYSEQILGLTDDFIDLSVERQAIPDIVRVLAAGHIDIFGVSLKHTSLEDAFIHITGGGTIIA